MATTSLLRYSARPDLYVCARCAFRASRNSNKASRRWIGMKYLAKAADAQVAWAKNAAEIKTGKKKSMLSILEERGYVHQITGSYGAFTPRWPLATFHVPVLDVYTWLPHGIVSWGATAKIGDPTDRLTTREKMKSTTRNENILKMHYQLKGIWLNVEAYGRKYGYQWEWAWRRGLVNNHHWMNKLTVMELLQILGPGMRIGAMIAKDTVKNKMNNGDGMSYSEFSYPLLQSWDWWHMYNTKGITMQIGGSDQYGNITAGIDAVKYILANHPDPVVKEQHKKAVPPLGFTVPLLTTSAGAKFGKSAGNALWLDKDMMSSFDLYAYFLRTSDQDVERYLKLFTFMPMEQINKTMEEHMKEPHSRKAQHALARDFLELIHGVPDAKAAELKHRLLFSKSSNSANVEELQRDLESVEGTVTSGETKTGNINASNRPKADLKLPRSFVMTRSIARIVVAAGLCATASEANRLCGASGLYVGGSRPLGYQGKDDALVLPRLKHGKTRILITISLMDQCLFFDEYISEGLSFPGNEDWIKQKMPKKLNEEGEIIEEEKNPNILSTGVDISDRDEIRRLRRERSHEKSQQRWQDREPRRLERMQLLQADLRETDQLSSEKIDLDKLVKRVKSDVSVDKDRLVRKIDFDERSKLEDFPWREDETKS
ncbi:Tyrosine-tRNA ligase, mitochondrial [Botrytis cinerea]